MSTRADRDAKSAAHRLLAGAIGTPAENTIVPGRAIVRVLHWASTAGPHVVVPSPVDEPVLISQSRPPWILSVAVSIFKATVTIEHLINHPCEKTAAEAQWGVRAISRWPARL